ncbi:hypothetical protein A3G63_02755 [Candidatus Kaiserbacteria bacterium RIFCSPLOWO2_12_FULL_52_8]|uniref:Uncharacterized protein n=1 Tax=Candidatus Kaiserbacteria bacterium RIFCSPHIGHO2_01_FULL_53_31 TaxID=1798481 RepID=A0A1F6CHE3_9BACT|nr:MAG: hypothetical protein A2678_03620 [Candidatus Kaiserbacteria bacterium RIFCSPHIGHO2_01_FULL_53_31]OGG92592.1 MAG: hypothetical protein A3G63_02755 [Candidatus Kaiserbacteria bacterium RIFCSPLOWO2_12_FULL_52_8]
MGKEPLHDGEVFGQLSALFAPVFAGAATLSFTMLQTTVGTGDPFEINVILSTKNDINAIEAALIIPHGLELVNTNNGNSLINFWIEQPRYDRETRTLTFSGITPNGFSGTRRLLGLTLKTSAPGTYTLSFDPAHTTLYQNGPSGIPEPTTIEPLVLQIVNGTARTSVPAIDTEPPEAFTPIVIRTPQLYDGAWTLIFATQDKGSGIARYEVSESPARRADSSALNWTKAESPYQLSDQSLTRYIYVRAVDEQGNARTELFTSSRPFPWFESLLMGILIATLVLFSWWLRRKKRHYASP